MLCLLQGPAYTPPCPADKAEPFIPVTSHKSSHQLRAHNESPDPSITEGRRRRMNNEAISAFPPWAQKRMIDFLCPAIMCIRHQSIKYSLLLPGMSCDGAEGNWIPGWRWQNFALIIQSRSALNEMSQTQLKKGSICWILTQSQNRKRFSLLSNLNTDSDSSTACLYLYGRVCSF